MKKKNDPATDCLLRYLHRIMSREWEKFDRTTAYSCAMRGQPFSQKRMEEAWAHWEFVREQFREELSRLEK